MSERHWPEPDAVSALATLRGRRNRRGVTGIRWRLGGFAAFRDHMLARLPRSQIGAGPPWLARLNAAADGRFAHALTDAWALVAEILSFYQDRIAEEAFVATAVLPDSLVALAHTVGYRRSPGTSAEAELLVQVMPTVRQWTLPAGLAIESVPLPGEDAAIFETDAPALLDAAWNAMRIRSFDGVVTAPAGRAPIVREDGVTPGALLAIELTGDATRPTVAPVDAIEADDVGPVVVWRSAPATVRRLGWFSREARLFGFASPPWDTADASARLAAGSRALGGLFVPDAEGWAQQPVLVDAVRAVVRGRRHVFLATASGVHRWSAGAARLETVNTGLEQIDVLRLVRDRAGALYAGTASGGVFRSTDEGDTWASVDRPITRVTRRRGTFITAEDDTPRSAVQALAVSGAAQTARLLVGTARGVYLSRDGGGSWRAVSEGLPPAVVAVALDAETLWVGTEAGVFRAPMDADPPAWEAVGASLPDQDIRGLLLNDGVLYVGTRTAGIYRTRDGGASFAAAGCEGQILLRLMAGADATGAFIAAICAGAVSPAARADAERAAPVAAPITDPPDGAGTAALAPPVAGRTFISRTGGRTWTPLELPDGVAPRLVGDRVAYAPQDGFAHDDWPELFPVVRLDLEAGGSPPAVGSAVVIDQPAVDGADPAGPRFLQALRVVGRVTAVDTITRRDPASGVLRPAVRLTLVESPPYAAIDPRRARVSFERRPLVLRPGRADLSGAIFSHAGDAGSPGYVRVELMERVPAIPRRQRAWIIGRRLRGLLPAGTVLEDPQSSSTEKVLVEELVSVLREGDDWVEVRRESGFVGRLTGPAQALLERRPALEDDPEVRCPATVVLSETREDHSVLGLLLDEPSDEAIRFDRSTVVVCANTVHATQGVSTEEVIGSGSAAAVYQRFGLPDAPVARLPADTPTGERAALEVLVGDATNYSHWQAADRLVDAGPGDRVFLETVDDTGVSTLTFGDGLHGSRLPTGTDNVIARYRLGLGAAGNVPADRLSRLAAGSAIVEAIRNPIAARGGSAPEPPGVARTRIPHWVAPADRVVAWSDLAPFALTRPGVARAAAHRRTDGSTMLTIAGPSEETPADIPRLRRALRAAADPLFDVDRIMIEPPTRYPFFVEARLLLDRAAPTVDEEERIIEAATAELAAAYAFAVRPFGAAVSAARIIAHLQASVGVRAVFLDALDLVAAPRPGLQTHLRPPSRPDEPAGVLVIAPDEIRLMVVTR